MFFDLYCIVCCSVMYSMILLVLFRFLSFLFDLVSFSFVSFFSVWIIVFLYCIVYCSVMYCIVLCFCLI